MYLLSSPRLFVNTLEFDATANTGLQSRSEFLVPSDQRPMSRYTSNIRCLFTRALL